MNKSNILLLVLLVFAVSLANTAQAEKKQAKDYQKQSTGRAGVSKRAARP